MAKAEAKWYVNNKKTDYYDIYPIVSTIKKLKLKIANNTIIVDYNNGYISINDEVSKPRSSTETYEPLYLRRTRGEHYDKTKKKIVPNFLGWLIGWTATSKDGKTEHIKAVWINPDGTFEWRDHK